MLEKYKSVRAVTEEICQPLAQEDYVVQPIEDVSPPKWHLGHTTWFFETFILKEFVNGYKIFDEQFNFVFNSYYESKGERILRSNRGNLSRPTVDRVYNYRKYVDEQMSTLLESTTYEQILMLTELGLNHEQQHQELLFTDIKYILGTNPLLPVYKESNLQSEAREAKWLKVEGGNYQIGHEGEGFHWDNEEGYHQVYLHGYEFQDRMVTNGEYLKFIEDNGYGRFHLWTSEGWKWVTENNIEAPLYWYKVKGEWYEYTLGGLKPIDLNAPVTHISYFEADAYAGWRECRLLTEFEWEVACNQYGTNDLHSNFWDSRQFHPTTGSQNQLLGDCWEWTNSSYLAYPFYKKDKGALGEYNGKFMINQMVLRGGSCVTPQDHIRSTYRNFFPTDARWQFTGIRLARFV